jgi:hypothetical protein
VLDTIFGQRGVAFTSTSSVTDSRGLLQVTFKQLTTFNFQTN